jgi:hypothetical protein
VAEKMAEAVRRGSFDQRGRAMRRTLKRLGIGDSYRAVREWLEAD